MELRIAPVIRFVTIVTALLKLTVVSCVPMKYEIGYRNSIDLDAEQTEARYDQGMLSDIMNDDRVELQKAESCVADNFKYDHGQKIQRYDPCEICLCIDGEIFCWWKQCDVPTKPELSGNPAAAIDTTNQLKLTNPSSTTSTTTTPPPSSDLSQLPPYHDGQSGLSSTTTVTSSAIPSTTTGTGSVALVDSSSAVLPSSSPDDAGGTATAVRILHPPPPESIPQNILSFPQTPPIMMYRPALPVQVLKNGSSVGIPLLAGEQHRNKHRPLKKVNQGIGKKPFRKSQKSKDYAINFGQLDGNTGADGKMAVAEPPSMTERITSGPPVSFDEAAGRLTVGDRNDGQEAWRRKQEEDDEEDDEDDEEDEEEDDEEDGSAEAELRGQIYDGGSSRSGGRPDESRTGSKGSSSSGDRNNNNGDIRDQFGGYGYGMFKEPDEDKQPPQHYIITSSGHVEMFDDDTSMEATENAFGLNRFPSAGGSASDSSTTGQPAVGSDQPVPPLITMTTNVTQNWNYSGQQQQQLADGTSGQGPLVPLTPFVPLASSGGSVIDVLNSTTMDGVGGGGGGGGGGGLDYLDDNQTELIYPAVPGLSGANEGESSSRRSGGPDRQAGLGAVVTAMTTTTTTGVSGASDSASSLTTAASSAERVVEKHCVVMGVSYKVGSVLKQETGNCLHCVCVAGPDNDPVPRVTCTPLNCPPLILPDILDGAGF